MICHRCLQRAARSHTASSSRSFSQSFRARSTPVSAAVPTQTNPRPHDQPAATTTPSVAQPLSAPQTPSPSSETLPISRNVKKAVTAKLPASSIAAGTALRGINFYKNNTDPIALEDHEYPAWLWSVLEKKAGDESKVEVEGDLFAKSKKQRRKAAKALRKQEGMNPGGSEAKIPLHEQTVDLPAIDALEAASAREELTKSMRDGRRKKIKEDNFLRAMR